MTIATVATDNAPAAAAAAAATRADHRRITEADPDFQRLHAQTVRKLLASLRAYVRALRAAPASEHAHIASAFIHRQVGMLRAAYTAAHQEGVRDYYAGVSRQPGRWLHTALAPRQPASQVVSGRLGFYAPSVAKMAHEALGALGRERSAAAATAAGAAHLAEVPHQPAHTGVMVAFMLAPQAAEKLAIAGGEPPEDLHITLAFLGEKTDMNRAQIQQLQRTVAGFAAEALPLRGRITGVDRFPGQPDDETYPCFAAVDIPGIQRWRAQLVAHLKADGLPVDETFHDYHPHITLAYVPKGEPLPVKKVPLLPLVLDHLTLALGDERHTWRIGDEQYSDTAAAKLAETIPGIYRLAGDPPGNTGDFLDGIGPRVELQAEITWSGFNDGYVDAGGADPANPYAVIYWDLEPLAKHCFDCPAIAAGSPYDPPWVQGGNPLNATPGDGHTECGAGCKCALRYGAGAGPDPRGTVWDSPDAPPAPPGPDGEDGQPGQPGQPGTWPNIAGVDDMSALSEEQQQALQESFDAYRKAFERWEAIRGDLPSLPDMFGVAGGEGVAGVVWPAWESLSPAQQLALKAVFEALAAYDAAAGSPTLQEVEAGLAGNAASLDAITSRAGELQDELDALVQAAQAEEQQTKVDLFRGGPLRARWQKFVHNLDQYFDWLLSRTGEIPDDTEEFGEPVDAGDAIRLYNPNHYPAGSRQGGQFAPRGGGEMGGGEEQVLRGAGGAGEHPLVHAHGSGGGGGGGGGSGRESTTSRHAGGTTHGTGDRSGSGSGSHQGDGAGHDSELSRLRRNVEYARAWQQNTEMLLHQRNEELRALVHQLPQATADDPQIRAAVARRTQAVNNRELARRALEDAEAEYAGRGAYAHEASSTLDEHGQTMPFTRGAAMEAWPAGRRLSNGGNVNEVKEVTLDGREWAMKSARDDYRASAEDQQTAEAATVAGLRALGMGEYGPHEAYHIVGPDGTHYALSTLESGESRTSAQMTHFITEEHLQEAWLAEYMLGMKDRHMGNNVVDAAQGSVRHIDFGYGLKHNTMVESRSWARLALKLKSFSNPDASRHDRSLIDRAVAVRVLGREGMLLHALEPFGLSAGRLAGIRNRFAALRHAFEEQGATLDIERFAQSVGEAPEYATGTGTGREG